MKPGDVFLAFTADHDEAEARARYRQRCGGEPEQVVRENGLLLLGPVKEAA